MTEALIVLAVMAVLAVLGASTIAYGFYDSHRAGRQALGREVER